MHNCGLDKSKLIKIRGNINKQEQDIFSMPLHFLSQNKLNFKITNLVHVHVEEYLNNLVQLISKYTCIFFLK